MAINRLQFGGLLNPKESFGWEEYGQPGPQITTPSLLGAGVFGDVAGKKLRTQRGLSCPTGTQPNASNTACVPIQKAKTTLTCAQQGLVDDGMGGCKSKGSTTITNTTCAQRGLVSDGMGGCKRPDGTTTTTTTNGGCIYGKDKYGNCIDPTGKSDWYDYVAPGMEPWAKATGPEPGGGPEDWRGPAAGFGTDIGSRVGNAVVGPDGRLQFGGLTDAQKAEIAGQNIGTSALAGQTGYYVPQGFDDFGAMSAPGIQLFPNERPAPLSAEDFIAQYSRPPKTVDQGILGPAQEAAAARRIEDVYGMDNILAPAPVKYVPDRGPSVDDFSDFEEQRVERQVEEAKERSKAQKSAKKKLEKIKESQAADKKKADEKRAQADFHAKEAQKAFAKEMAKAQERRKAANLKSKGTFKAGTMQVGLLGAR